MYTPTQIAEITNTCLVGDGNYNVLHFSNDSRTIHSPADTVFVALKTSRNNGHQYIEELIDKGVRCFVIRENEFNYHAFTAKGISFILSEHPLKTIQQLAAYHRQRFSIPVIGITGSNGKTMVKEWLYQLLKNDYVICRSPKSYNSQIGVALSVLNLNEKHTLGIFEAGISQGGEMELLASMIRPNIGVFTSLGSAHDEGFENRSQKLAEKLKLFAGCDTLVINGLPKKEVNAIGAKTVFVSELEDADLKMRFENAHLYLESAKASYKFEIPFKDQASLSNASTCATLMLQLGINHETIADRLKLLQPVALRLEIKNGINNSLIINDYYNSDLDSIRIALSYLQQQNRRDKKIVVISDIEQSGIPAAELYGQLANLLQQNGIDRVIGIGNEITAHRALFKHYSAFFNDTNAFAAQFKTLSQQLNNATILLKGARSFGFESISNLLQLKSHDTVFEINLDKLTANVNYYRGLMGANVKLMCMVKAMGYGSGSSDIAKTLQHIGANYLAVAYADEGVELREAKIALPIMVMSPEEDGFEDIINYNLEPEIYSFKVLHGFVKKLDALGVSEPYPVHLKLDTGMHRLGFEKAQIGELLADLKQFPQLKVRSVFSHLSAADNPELDFFTVEQIRVFENLSVQLEKALGYTFLKHICNSAGISRFKEAHYDMVRLGIGMYGVGVNAHEQHKLENVGTLKTRISQIKQLKAGETVSYNRSGKIEHNSRVATLPIGYADGFSRQLGNGRHGVFIKGKFCKTIGNVCMDMCMVDVSDISCNEGDEVILFENTEQINAMAKVLNSIPYEILTNVSGRVKRVYVKE